MLRLKPLEDSCITAICIDKCIGARSTDPVVVSAYPRPCIVTRRTIIRYKRIVKPSYYREKRYCIVEKPFKAVYPVEACDLLDKVTRGETPSAALLGPPGTGKSSFLNLVERSAPVNVIRFNPEDIISKYIGDTEKQLRNILNQCEASEPCLLLIDEGDMLIEKRGRGGDEETGYNQMTDNLKRELLRRMQTWYNEGRRIGIIVTSNRSIDVLETAMLRAGRFGEPIYFPIPDAESLRILFKLYNKTIDDKTLSDIIKSGTTFSNIVEYIKTGKLKRFQPAPFAVLEYSTSLRLGFKLSEKARIIIAEEFPLSARLSAIISSSIYDRPVLILKDKTKIMDFYYLGESMKMPVAIPYSKYVDGIIELFYNYPYPVFYLGKYWDEIPYIVMRLEDIAKYVGDEDLYQAICGKEPPQVMSGGLRSEVMRCLSGFEYTGKLL